MKRCLLILLIASIFAGLLAGCARKSDENWYLQYEINDPEYNCFEDYNPTYETVPVSFEGGYYYRNFFCKDDYIYFTAFWNKKNYPEEKLEGHLFRQRIDGTGERECIVCFPMEYMVTAVTFDDEDNLYLFYACTTDGNNCHDIYNFNKGDYNLYDGTWMVGNDYKYFEYAYFMDKYDSEGRLLWSRDISDDINSFYRDDWSIEPVNFYISINGAYVSSEGIIYASSKYVIATFDSSTGENLTGQRFVSSGMLSNKDGEIYLITSYFEHFLEELYLYKIPPNGLFKEKKEFYKIKECDYTSYFGFESSNKDGLPFKRCYSGQNYDFLIFNGTSGITNDLAWYKGFYLFGWDIENRKIERMLCLNDLDFVVAKESAVDADGNTVDRFYSMLRYVSYVQELSDGRIVMVMDKDQNCDVSGVYAYVITK